MRLGDLDALKEYLMEEYECDACHDDDDDWFAGRASAWWAAQVHVDDMPTIDAIPVEWMRDKMRGYASSLKSTETAALVMVMQMWQKEQEAR